MKRLLTAVAVGILAVAFVPSLVVAAIVSIERMDHQRQLPQAFHKGIYITTFPDDGTDRLANKLTSALGASATIDFPFAPDGGALDCNDSAPISVPGANVGDACIVSNSLSDGGTLNARFSCYVSYADYARVRHCAGAQVVDPPSATYYVRILGK